MDYIELSDGTFIKSKSLTRNEYLALKKDMYSNTSISEYKEKYNTDVYELKNKQILINQEDVFLLLDDLEDASRLLEDHAESSNDREALYNKNPYGKDFPKHTKDLIKELADTLDIVYVNYDEGLLKQVDSKLYKLPNPALFKKKHLINLIAVVGEVLRKKYHTEWFMILSDDRKTWNPYLKSDDRPINFFMYLYEDIYINNVDSDDLLFEIYETVNDIKKEVNR